jgi:hypothetical protein
LLIPVEVLEHETSFVSFLYRKVTANTFSFCVVVRWLAQFESQDWILKQETFFDQPAD